MSLTEDIDDVDIYSEEIEDMDEAVTIVATLEFVTGIVGIIVMLMNIATSFEAWPLGVSIAFLATGIVIGSLGILAIYAGWGLWQLKHWAWRTALAVNIASLAFTLLTFNLIFILLNAVLIVELRRRRIRNIYADIQLD
ncbi:MAG: hypothetical protein ACW99G_05350 [Candidatus Thorarchaeota archaeon]